MKLYLDNRRTAVYRLYDAMGRLLYIGITCNPESRFRDHAGTKDWWREVDRKDLVWYETRKEALDVEFKAIGKERPLRNVQHSGFVSLGRHLTGRNGVLWRR